MSKTKKDIMTDEILKKAHYHELKAHTPQVCPACGGMGTVSTRVGREWCHVCEGEGVVYYE